MNKVFAWIGGSIIFVLIVIAGFWCWTEIEHDKSALKYVQDEWGWFEDKDDTLTNDEIVVEDEATTATIKF